MVLNQLVSYKPSLSRLGVTEEGRIIMRDYNNTEVLLEPMQRALYIFFLKHSEGVRFKEMPDYQKELIDIYRLVSPRTSGIMARYRISRLCDPLRNTLNEQVARIKAAFISRWSESAVGDYLIDGTRGELRRIALDRSLVDC